MIEIRYVRSEDKEFWYRLDKHLPEKEFENKVACQRGYVLLDDSEPIGLLRYSLFWDNTPFCTLLFVDWKYQGKGYGKAALKLLIARLFCEYQCNTIYLSLYQQNKHAYHLYTSFGFQENGEKDVNGETVMCLQKNHESVRQLNEISG